MRIVSPTSTSTTDSNFRFRSSPPSPRYDDEELLPELLERRQIEMVVVRMRDQDGVEAAPRSRVDGSHAAQVRDRISKERISDETHAVEVDHDSRMSDVLDPRHAVEHRPSGQTRGVGLRCGSDPWA